MQTTARINIDTVASICRQNLKENEESIALILVNQYPDYQTAENNKHDTEDPFSNLSETLTSNVIDHISHTVEEVDKPMSDSYPFEIEHT